MREGWVVVVGAGRAVPPVWHCSSQPGVPYHGRGLPASARTQRSPAQNQCLVALGPGSGSGSGVCVVAIGSRHVSSTEVRTGASIMMVGSAAALLPRHPDAYRQGGRGPAAWVALQVRRRGGAALLATEQHVAQGTGGGSAGWQPPSRASAACILSRKKKMFIVLQASNSSPCSATMAACMPCMLRCQVEHAQAAGGGGGASCATPVYLFGVLVLVCHC
eukprot:COSAG04_NODE_3083_length_3187_cov_4.600389_3_plen_219_part_00